MRWAAVQRRCAAADAPGSALRSGHAPVGAHAKRRRGPPRRFTEAVGAARRLPCGSRPAGPARNSLRACCAAAALEQARRVSQQSAPAAPPRGQPPCDPRRLPGAPQRAPTPLCTTVSTGARLSRPAPRQSAIPISPVLATTSCRRNTDRQSSRVLSAFDLELPPMGSILVPTNRRST